MSSETSEKLSRVRLLQNLSEAAIATLEQRSKWRRIAAGEQILGRDSTSRDVFLVVEGMVEVVNFAASGQEVAFGQVRAGGYFGEMSAIDGEHRSANIVAVEDSRVLVVPPGVFVEMMTENPPAAMQVLRRLTHIIRTADDRIMDLSTLKAVQRVYIELLRLAEDDAEGNCRIAAVPIQRDMARRASTTRETVSRVLSQLARDGITERKGRVLLIHDKALLMEMTDALAADDGENLR
ncbi:MAG: Crp/Fnr family transcriptional regulator [Rhodospirillaceae bacterium]|nr:Crp/Fnr family transcriptional regulator [Rhodospirillaceae bacterium]